MNELIAYLVAIKGYSKNIHYTVHGESFYGKHIFVDIISDPIDGFIDSIKEICLLGKLPAGERPLETSEYDRMAKDLYPELSEENDAANYIKLQQLITKVLEHIEELDGLSKGSENLIGAVAEHLQKMNGLLNLQNL